jgi:hypothetical protein
VTIYSQLAAAKIAKKKDYIYNIVFLDWIPVVRVEFSQKAFPFPEAGHRGLVLIAN